MRRQDHDAVLDGLRGIAAFAVLIFHLGHWFGVPGLATNSGLAVDFFFCLSGYVLTMVYRQRLDAGWGFARFLELRLVRLMPMIVVGTLASAAYVAFRTVAKHGGDGYGSLAVATALGVADLPYLYAPKGIGGPQVFPLNGPQYSLFLEIVVNISWASAIVLRGRRAALLFAILGVAGIALFGLGGDETATFWNGIPRVFGSFYLGILAFDVGPWLRVRAQRLFPFGLIIMAMLFFWPVLLPSAFVIFWVTLLSPVVVATGAGAELPASLRPLGLLLGRLSFPIYALHYPLFCWINGLVQIKSHRQIPIIEIPLILVIVPIFAWLLLVFYDEPLRKRLDRRIRGKKNDVATSAVATLEH